MLTRPDRAVSVSRSEYTPDKKYKLVEKGIINIDTKSVIPFSEGIGGQNARWSPNSKYYFSCERYRPADYGYIKEEPSQRLLPEIDEDVFCYVTVLATGKTYRLTEYPIKGFFTIEWR